jgi:hypothetical protein
MKADAGSRVQSAPTGVGGAVKGAGGPALECRSSASAQIGAAGKVPTRRWRALAPLVLLLVLALFPRLLSLDVFLTPDEALLYQNSRDFLLGLRKWDLGMTFGWGYPGATTMALGAAGMALRYLAYRAGWVPGPGAAGPGLGLEEFLAAGDRYPVELVAAGRTLVVLTVALGLIGIYLLARRLLSEEVAFVGSLLLALDPYVMGYSRLLHNDILMALFMALSVLAFLVYLHEGRRVFLALSAVTGGLALVSKSQALYLPATIILIALLSWFGQPEVTVGPPWLAPAGQGNRSYGGPAAGRGWKPLLRVVVLWLGVAALAFWAAWPAMWGDPLGTLTKTAARLATEVQIGYGNRGTYFLGGVSDDPGPLFYPVAFAFKSTPLLLLGLLAGCWSLLTCTFLPQRAQPSREYGVRSMEYGTPNSNSQLRLQAGKSLHLLRLDFSDVTVERKALLALGVSILVYMLAAFVSAQKSVRYFLPAYPATCFVAAYGLVWLSRWLWKAAGSYSENSSAKLNHKDTKTQRHKDAKKLRGLVTWCLSGERLPGQEAAMARPGSATQAGENHPTTRGWLWKAALPVVVLVQGLWTFSYHPYYFTYYSPLAGGGTAAARIMMVGWGEGLDEAAGYLNDKAGADRLTAVSWYEWVFAAFFHGETRPLVFLEDALRADYVIFYVNQVQRVIPDAPFVSYFRGRQPEHVVRLNGVEYAWIYPGPAVSQGPDPPVQHRVNGDFGGQARLLGYDLGEEWASSDSPLHVTLYWRVLAPLPPGISVYLRLVDQEGHIWGRTDSPPVGGLWPAERWEPGTLVRDDHQLPVLPGTPPGDYQIEAGLYDPAAARPLAAGGAPLGPGGGLILGGVSVARPQVFPRAEALAMGQIVGARLAPGVELLGFDFAGGQAASGQKIPLVLYWRAGAEPRGDYLALLQMRDGAGKVHKEWQGKPAGGYGTARWQAGEVVRDPWDLVAPANVDSGSYQLAVALADAATGGRIGDEVALGKVTIESRPRNFAVPLIAHPLSARLGGVAELLGYDLGSLRLEPGGELQLTLYWRALAETETSYTVFVHLLGPDGAIHGQRDQPPGAGTLPTSGWVTGEVIVDSWQVPLQEGAPPGQYVIEAGMYDPVTGERLPVEGQPEAGGAVVVGRIAVGAR